MRIEGVAGETPLVEVAASFATGLHQVDNPVFDRDGNLYVTYSGTRGQQVPVCIFRVRPDGTRESFATGIVNPTSMAIGPDGRLYVSSRFEGTVYRVAPDGTPDAVRHRPRRRVRPRVRARRHACSSATDPARSSASTPDGRATSVRVAAAERRGVSPGDGPGRRALRHGADAVVVRRGLSHRRRRRR